MSAAHPAHADHDDRLTLAMVVVNEQRLAQQRRMMQYSATRVLAEATTLSETVPRFLKAVAEPGGWAAACLWLDDGKALRCTAVWHETGFDAGAWALRLRRTPVGLGQGLAGTAWAERRGHWAVVLDASDPGMAPGLHSSLAAPIVIGGAIVGVLQLFATEVRQRDDSLLDVLSSLNTQIDQAFARRRMEKKRHAAELKCRQTVPQFYQTDALRRTRAVEAGVTCIQQLS